MNQKLIFVILCIATLACSKNSEGTIIQVAPGRNDQEICKIKKSDIDKEYVFTYEKSQTTGNYLTPTKLLAESNYPKFSDDLSFSGMELAIDRQLTRFAAMNLQGTIRLGGTKYRLSQAKKSLIAFKNLVAGFKDCLGAGKLAPDCENEFNSKLKRDFNVFVPDLVTGDPRFGESKSSLFTGYYTPLINASTSASTDFSRAIYSKPSADSKRRSTREEIDFKGKIANQGYEIYYTDDLFELYLMHVQGSGHVNIESKGRHLSRYLNYSGTNSQPWKFISKYMREKNYIQDGSIESQKDFLKTHPQLQEEIYSTCPSYVYFEESFDPPKGSGGAPVTDNRSIATDDSFYSFKGLLAFVVAERPEETQTNVRECKAINYKPFSRFYLDQDTGGAIRGKGRADLYFGEGEYAEKAAYNVVQRGDLYFLMLK